MGIVGALCGACVDPFGCFYGPCWCLALALCGLCVVLVWAFLGASVPFCVRCLGLVGALCMLCLDTFRCLHDPFWRLAWAFMTPFAWPCRAILCTPMATSYASCVCMPYVGLGLALLGALFGLYSSCTRLAWALRGALLDHFWVLPMTPLGASCQALARRVLRPCSIPRPSIVHQFGPAWARVGSRGAPHCVS